MWQQIQNEDKVDVGEWFFTSGEDRIFPKGFPVGIASSVQLGQGMKDVKISLSGAPGGKEEVLVVLQGVHRNIPSVPVVEQTQAAPLPAPPSEAGAQGQGSPKPQTEADKILQRYANIGKEQNHVYGAYGSGLPNFNTKPPAGQPSPAALPAAPSAAAAIKPETAPSAVRRTGPQVLGARPDAPPPIVGVPADTPRPTSRKTESAGPALPLGAPRRKIPDTSTTGSQPQTRANDRSQ